MVMISTLDRFLGSLLGSYMGFHYRQPEWPALHSDPLYTAWIKPPLLELQCTSNGYAPLPWLLYCYDNSTIRHHELAKHLEHLSVEAADPDAMTTLSTLYILGDSLEWLMQCPLSSQQALPQLLEYLQQQQVDYPSTLHGFALFGTPLASNLSKPDNAHSAALNVALEQSLNHRENLALALNSSMPRFTRTMLGCLLGAWGGISVIPTSWMLLLAPEVKQAITLLASQLYQSWAGISSAQGTLETFPLDL